MGTIPRDTHTEGSAPVTTHDPTKGVVTFQEEVVHSAVARKFLAGLRIVLGFTFLWPFMAGLLGIGIALLAGAGLKIAAWTAALLLALMYLAEFPLGTTGVYTNPLIDSHWIEALGVAVLATTLAGDTWGLGKWWGRHVGNGLLR